MSSEHKHILTLSDKEIVFRTIFENTPDKTYYSYHNDNIRITATAFEDRYQKPSVDIASLNGFCPCKSKRGDPNGVIGLFCFDIRLIDDVSGTSSGNNTIKYYIDVIHNPESTNYSHAQIEPKPEYQSKSVFRKTRKSLARLATQVVAQNGWLVKPIGALE